MLEEEDSSGDDASMQESDTEKMTIEQSSVDRLASVLSPEAPEFVPNFGVSASSSQGSSERTSSIALQFSSAEGQNANIEVPEANNDLQNDVMPPLVMHQPQPIALHQAMPLVPPPAINQEPSQTGNEHQLAAQPILSSQSTQSAHSSAISQEPVRYKMNYLEDVTSIFNWLMSIPKITDLPTENDIRSMRTTITVILGKIRHCQFNQSSYKPLIMARVLRSLTAGIRTAYRLQALTNCMSFAEFREFLVSVEEMIDGGFKFDEEEGISAKRFKASAAPSMDWADQRGASCSASTSTYPRAKQVKKQKTVSKSKKYPPCLYCQNCEHAMFHCDPFLELFLQARWNYVRENGICENCLVAKHGNQPCKKGPCTKCDLKQNSVLCPKNQQNHRQ